MGDQPTYKPANRESGHSAKKTSSCCCGKRCWVVVAIVAILLLLIAVGGIGGLIRLLQKATHPIEFVKAVDECTQCPKCYACLEGFTGQSVTSLCMSEDLSTVLQCSAQILYLYSKPNINDSIPCYSECRSCRNCLNKLSFGTLELATTLWETLFAHLFAEPQDVGDLTNECKIDCTPELNCTWSCPATMSQARRKRALSQDGDACCQTMRERLPYLLSYTDPMGNTWYPVWFHKPWATPPYSFQVFDDITCPLAQPSCDNQLTCRQHSDSHTMLMSRNRPNESYGYTFILLTYPSSKAQFITLELPCYCRCTN